MKKYIIICIILLGFSCRKKVSDKFPTGIYEFVFDLSYTQKNGETYHNSKYKFPVKLIDSNDEELKMQFYEIKLGSGDTLFAGISILQIKKRKDVEGEMYRGDSVESTILFTNGEILKKENKIIGDFNFEWWHEYALGGGYYWLPVSGTYTFSKKE